MKLFDRQCRLSEDIEVLKISCSRPELTLGQYNSGNLYKYYGVEIKDFGSLQ